jgi:hypothetical protein
MKSTIGTLFVTTLIVMFFLSAMGGLSWVSAQVMTSSNYSIQSDSINFGGGQSNSSTYKIEDTLGEVGTGDSSSSNYNLHAGYQQMDTEIEITMTEAGNVTMSPSLGGITGGTSNGDSFVNVTTNNPVGYELYIKASSSPAMQGDTQSDTIADYTKVGANPDFDFSVSATDAEFGFSPEGTHIVALYKDNGAACNVGSSDTADKCWDSLSTSNKLIASSATANNPGGTQTTIKFRLTVGTSSFKIEDTYTATTTLTAVTL